MRANKIKHYIEKNGPSVKCTLVGDLTYTDHSAFIGMLDTVLEYKLKDVSFNVSEVTFIDSAGLGMLLIAHEKIVADNRTFSLLQPSGQVKKLIEFSHLTQVLSIAS